MLLSVELWGGETLSAAVWFTSDGAGSQGVRELAFAAETALGTGRIGIGPAAPSVQSQRLGWVSVTDAIAACVAEAYTTSVEHSIVNGQTEEARPCSGLPAVF